MNAYHQQIRIKDPIFQDAVSLIVWVEFNVRNISVLVTDNVKNTKWNNNPNTEKFIRNHPFFKNKNLKEIIYWNQNEIGDWGVLKESANSNDSRPTARYVGAVDSYGAVHFPTHQDGERFHYHYDLGRFPDKF